jgi:hypothetical protein
MNWEFNVEKMKGSEHREELCIDRNILQVIFTIRSNKEYQIDTQTSAELLVNSIDFTKPLE